MLPPHGARACRQHAPDRVVVALAPAPPRATSRKSAAAQVAAQTLDRFRRHAALNHGTYPPRDGGDGGLVAQVGEGFPRLDVARREEARVRLVSVPVLREHGAHLHVARGTQAAEVGEGGTVCAKTAAGRTRQTS